MPTPTSSQFRVYPLSSLRRPRLLMPALVLLLASCAGQRAEMQQQSLAQMPGKKLALVTYVPPAFVDLKPGTAAVGAEGIAEAQQRGNSLASQYKLRDPAPPVAALLADRMVQERGMVLLPAPQSSLATEDIRAVIASQPGADYILDIKTTGWSTIFYPTDWSRYKVSYSARLRLIDTHTRLVVAQQVCNSVQKDNEASPPNKDELLAYDASLLKQRLVQGASDCMKGFAATALKLAVGAQQAYVLPLDAAGGLDPDALGDISEEELAAAASPNPVGVVSKRWRATISCSASTAPNARQPNDPFTRGYDVDVSRYPVIRLRRRSTTVAEVVAGKVIDGRMLMRGTGYQKHNPGFRWAVRLDGAFNGDGSAWEVSGGFFVRNTLDRSCTMSLKKV